jgi:hypothetical protein
LEMLCSVRWNPTWSAASGSVPLCSAPLEAAIGVACRTSVMEHRPRLWTSVFRCLCNGRMLCSQACLGFRGQSTNRMNHFACSHVTRCWSVTRRTGLERILWSALASCFGWIYTQHGCSRLLPFFNFWNNCDVASLRQLMPVNCLLRWQIY